MAGKGAKIVAEGGSKPVNPAQRLCNEIQLFDLCELERCGHKKGLFCTRTELLNSFEAIAEEEECPAGGLISDKPDDGEETDVDGYDDSLDDDQFVDEGYEEDHEDE